MRLLYSTLVAVSFSSVPCLKWLFNNGIQTVSLCWTCYLFTLSEMSKAAPSSPITLTWVCRRQPHRISILAFDLQVCMRDKNIFYWLKPFLFPIPGQSVYWQHMFQKSPDPTFVFLTFIWHALYAWDEALENLYEHICYLVRHHAPYSSLVGLNSNI